MDNKKIPDKRENGIFYTPDGLAKYLARPLIKGKNLTVFDPAYGEGALLLASEAISNEGSSSQKIQLFGCDIHPVNGLLTHLPAANLVEQDFFEYNREKKFDLILTNPPYVKHQSQQKELIERYRKNNPELSLLSNSSDLWAYFLIKSIVHLHENGALGAILPWAFIQADYSKKLRAWLAERFAEIKILALNNPYFESAQERVVLLWLKGYGKQNKTIFTAFTKEFTDEFEFTKISRSAWEKDKVTSVSKVDLDCIFNNLKDNFGFVDFKTLADTRIGIVTGANKYFIRDKEYVRSKKFTEKQVQPILTSATEISGLLANGIGGLKQLVTINESDADKLDWFIREGVESGFHLRSHSKNRSPWYAIKTGSVPDAFSPYRVGKIPYMILNDHQIQSVNSVHRIYFNGLTVLEKKWVLVSLLSIYGQLSLSINAKTYGRGMMKIEPGALGKTKVLRKKNRKILKPYKAIIKLLAKEKKGQAVRLATDFMDQNLGISRALSEQANSAWKEIKKIA